MKQRGWIAFSGFLWLVIGSFLLYKGIRFIAEGIDLPNALSFRFRELFDSSQQAATALVGGGLLLGFAKGQWVFSKTVQRTVARIRALPLPIRFTQVYAPSYWILIAAMVALGLSLRFLPVPVDVRGCIDVAVGFALVRGALFYFQAALSR